MEGGGLAKTLPKTFLKVRLHEKNPFCVVRHKSGCATQLQQILIIVRDNGFGRAAQKPFSV
jgi:hypothetical protein